MLDGEIKVISEHFQKHGDYGDHIAWNRIKKGIEVLAQQTHNSAMVQFTAEQLYGAAKDAGLHNQDIDDLISVIGKQHQ